MRIKGVCITCEHELEKDQVKCPECGAWQPAPEEAEVTKLSSGSDVKETGILTGPWDLALGNLKHGVINGRTVLLGGGPGAGKSTLTLQLMNAVGNQSLYVGAEETKEEVLQRRDRLKLKVDPFYMNALGNEGDVSSAIKMHKPKLVAIDSLQGLVGEDDGAQLKILFLCKMLAVEYMIPIIILSHVNKQEALAGKLTLQHKVDCTALIYAEKDGSDIRTILSTKNRMGPAFRPTLYDMTEKGLKHIDEEEMARRMAEEDEDEDD